MSATTILLAAITWNAKWIAQPGANLADWRRPVISSPLFRNEFVLDDEVESANASICGLGYYELRMNGAKVGDHVLDPVVSQYDERVHYVSYDVSKQLTRGANAIGIMLGNGWYNCHTAEVWHFDKASWRDYPKVIFQLDIKLKNGREIRIQSDSSWKVSDGPIRFDALRQGEKYDAREERPGWDSPKFDDKGWRHAQIVPGPGGLLEPQTAPPCKVVETLKPKSVKEVAPGIFVFDLGQNIAGWTQLKVNGKPGTQITLRYAEKLQENGDIDSGNIKQFVLNGEFQTDQYTLKGGGEEIWEPRFTYHGFRYVQVSGFPGAPTLDNLRGRVVHSDFPKIGDFSCSDPLVNRLQKCALWSYRGNFVGIPTDCPHREKNGWTGDAQLAAETGFCNFAPLKAYAGWIQTMADTQRPNGQLPGIVPSTGWGYNWGSGPAWDSALILIPWHAYLYTGNTEMIETFYENMKRYVDFCDSMATDHTVSFGLGDWCHVDRARIVTPALTSTAYYYRDARLLATFASMTNRPQDAERYTQLAEKIKTAFHAKFYRGDGIYAKGEQTALACALYQDLVPESEHQAVVEQLVKAVEAAHCRADFGILGAQYIPRALADNGHVELAYRIITQPEYPGWVHWINQGATTLWESWNGGASRNHIMFGDFSAWMYNYLAGICPEEEQPGFKSFTLRPNPVAKLDWVKAAYDSPQGQIRSEWKKIGQACEFRVRIPENVNAKLLLPASSASAVTVNGTPLPQAGQFPCESKEGKLLVSCPAGEHVFTVAQ